MISYLRKGEFMSKSHHTEAQMIGALKQLGFPHHFLASHYLRHRSVQQRVGTVGAPARLHSIRMIRPPSFGHGL